MKAGRRSAKIAISLDARLLDRVERMRALTVESRSAVISRALALLTAEDLHASKVSEYIAAYSKSPETADEKAAARATARRALRTLPWDDDA